MPRHKNSISGGKGGRPKGKGFKDSSASAKENGIACPVELCEIIRRADHVKEHLRETVLWTDQGLPASEMHPDYGGLSEQRKRHTDFFRINGYTKLKMPKLQSTVAVKGPLDRLLEKRRGRDGVDNDREIASSFTKRIRLDENSNDVLEEDEDDPGPGPDLLLAGRVEDEVEGRGGAGGTTASLSTAADHSLSTSTSFLVPGSERSLDPVRLDYGEGVWSVEDSHVLPMPPEGYFSGQDSDTGDQNQVSRRGGVGGVKQA